MKIVVPAKAGTQTPQRFGSIDHGELFRGVLFRGVLFRDD